MLILYFKVYYKNCAGEIINLTDLIIRWGQMSFVGEIIDLPDLIQLSGELEEIFLDIIGRP